MTQIACIPLHYSH